MILSRRWRRHRHLIPPLALFGGTLAMGAAAIGFGAASGPGPGRTPERMAAPPPPTATPAALRSGPHASSVGVNLTVQGIPAIGQPAFTGRLGTADARDSSGRADYSHDPDHVKSLVTVAKPSGGTSGGAWTATNAVGMSLTPRGPELLRIATLRTDARCRPPHVRTTLTKPTVAGIPITDGEKRIPVTGAQLGYDRVSTGVLDVRMTRVQRTTPTTAEARAEITIDGTLFDQNARIYSGPIAHLVLGDVQAQCPGGAPEPADLRVRKTVNKTSVHVGGTVRYTLTAENDGGTLMDARFQDDMTRLLRHAAYNTDATATKGRLTYRRPHLTWTGHLTPGQKAKITFTVTARRPGKLRNIVTWNTPPGRLVTRVIPTHNP
ncbi:DUF11 domain-containing protein [Actinomadura oligospora]|uniref:DUF7927 domain-containing protein n=1 Tax=Actinomadura oligospora TaxID=111804 RepID=UPI0004AC5AC5|nr:DUF11 domain-containing protein [Actinomadura oligospora]